MRLGKLRSFSRIHSTPISRVSSYGRLKQKFAAADCSLQILSFLSEIEV
jgi:hypothetical protein